MPMVAQNSFYSFEISWGVFVLFLRFYWLIFREKGKEGERKGEKHWCERNIGCFSDKPPTHECALTGNQTVTFDLRYDAQPTEPHLSGWDILKFKLSNKKFPSHPVNPQLPQAETMRWRTLAHVPTLTLGRNSGHCCVWPLHSLQSVPALNSRAVSPCPSFGLLSPPFGKILLTIVVPVLVLCSLHGAKTGVFGGKIHGNSALLLTTQNEQLESIIEPLQPSVSLVVK